MTVFNKFLLLALLVALSIPAPKAEHLVIAAVNDTHSQITPAADNKGGLLRRRAIYDQIRRENKNTMIIHGGDGVQGTLYFSLFKGEVEFAAIDRLFAWVDRRKSAPALRGRHPMPADPLHISDADRHGN